MRAATLGSIGIAMPIITALCLGCASGAKLSRNPDPNRPSETTLSGAKSAAPPARNADSVTDDVPNKCKLDDPKESTDGFVLEPRDREVLARLAECVTAGVLRDAPSELSAGGWKGDAVSADGAFQLDRRQNDALLAD